jgi:hypothetical protein
MERPSKNFWGQQDTRAPYSALVFLTLIVGPVLAAGPVGKGIAGGVVESPNEIANG